MIDPSRRDDPSFRDVPPKLGTMGLSLAAIAFALTFITSPDYGIASDVANYFASSLRQLSWGREFFEGLAAGRPTRALDRDTVFETWRWYTERIPHPPLSRELGGLTWLASHRWLDTLTAYRLAVMLSYAALTGWVAIFTFWAAGSRLAGFAAGAAVISYPTLFAHGHLAHTDMFLASFWFASAAALAVFVRTRRVGWLVATGLLFGCAAATKFTGLLLGPVIAIWLVARRPRQALPALIVVALSAAAAFALVNPVLWVAPQLGLADYFGAGLERAGDAMARLRTEYFGVVYEYRPPAHYPWVWTLIVLPPTFIVAIAAALSTIRRHWLVSFCLLNMAVLYAALLLPSAPLHDGVRLFLPALAFQCVLVGVGTRRIVELLSARLSSAGRPWVEGLGVVAVLAPAAAVTVWSHPYQLSYLNLLVGGTAGAEARGLEVTNLKEVLSASIVADLDGIVPAGAVVDPGFLTEEICFYRTQGLADDWVIETWLPDADGGGVTLTCGPDDLLPTALARESRDPDYVFVLNRKAVWRPADRALFEHGGRPAFELTFDGVPLLRVFRTR